MVLRQPLRLWVLSNANVTTAHAVDKGLSLQLDRCLKEFYERESCSSSGGFGRNSLLEAFDEIGLEVSELTSPFAFRRHERAHMSLTRHRARTMTERRAHEPVP